MLSLSAVRALRRRAILTLPLLLAQCATVVDGTHQKILLLTIPDGARCSVTQNGNVVGTLAATPGEVEVPRTKYDLSVTCHKDGYADATTGNHSDANNHSYANAAVMGFGTVGWAVDSAMGADNQYTSQMHLNLEKLADTAK